MLLPSTTTHDQRSNERQWPTPAASTKAGPGPLHGQKLEELRQPLGHELRRADSPGAPHARLGAAQPHAGVLAAQQPEERAWAHRTVPSLSAHRRAALAPALDGKRLALALAACPLVSGWRLEGPGDLENDHKPQNVTIVYFLGLIWRDLCHSFQHEFVWCLQNLCWIYFHCC